MTSSYAANRTLLQMLKQATQMPFKKKLRTTVRGFQMYEVVGHNNQLEMKASLERKSVTCDAESIPQTETRHHGQLRPGRRQDQAILRPFLGGSNFYLLLIIELLP
jgi:hypothetical protein